MLPCAPPEPLTAACIPVLQGGSRKLSRLFRRPEACPAHAGSSDFRSLLLLFPCQKIPGPDRQNQSHLRKIGKTHQHIRSQHHARKDQISPLLLYQPQIEEYGSPQKKYICEIIIHNRSRAPAKAYCKQLPCKDNTFRHFQFSGTEKITHKRQQTHKQACIQIHAHKTSRIGKLCDPVSHYIGKICGKQPHGVHISLVQIPKIRIIISCIP